MFETASKTSGSLDVVSFDDISRRGAYLLNAGVPLGFFLCAPRRHLSDIFGSFLFFHLFTFPFTV